MSTRRARIKAVTSLPVRRKGPAKETNQATPSKAPISRDEPPELAGEDVLSLKKESVATVAPVESAADTPRRRAYRPAVQTPAKTPVKAPSSPARGPQNHAKAPQSPARAPQSPTKAFVRAPKSPARAPSPSKALHSPNKSEYRGPKSPAWAPPSLARVPRSPARGPPSPSRKRERLEKGEEPIDLTEECLFDPIIPLPSNNKNRPKLRPTPKLALRRNSLQGSASETEEVPMEPPPVPPSPLPALPGAPAPTPARAPRPRGPRGGRGGQGGSKARLPATHNALTMYDLIFYNPPNNAIKHEPPQVAPPEPTVVEPPPPSPPLPEAPEAAPVPQVKLGPNGEIVIDEQSLVIETSEALRSRQRLSQLSVVWDGGAGGRGVYGRGPRCREWGRAETLRFYRALHTLGTDFSLMLSLFPGRSRRDLKVKFKKEERQNGVLVDRALMNPLQFDIGHLEEEAALLARAGEEQEAKPAKKRRERKRKAQKSSAALDSITEDVEEAPPDVLTYGGKKYKSIRPKNLSSDTLAQEAVNLLRASGGHSEAGTSPGDLVPPNVEPGSLVILSGAPPNRELRAFIVQLVEGKPRLCPANLPPEVVRSIAAQVGVTQSPDPA